MDEKMMVSLNKLNLNAALAKQIAKRTDAPPPTPEKAQANMLAVANAGAFDADDFFVMWDKYYPLVVKLLGWASVLWFAPKPALTAIKSLLAVVNNNIIPVLRELLKKK